MTQDDARRVQVHDGLVHRPAHRWTPTVHDVLRHLHRRMPGGVPQPVTIRDDVGTVTWLPGGAGADCWPAQAEDQGLLSAARLLRAVHDASRDYVARPDAQWGMAPQAPAEVICHGDPGPWNMVWRDGVAVGLIDWDFAHPGPALEDLAYALEYVVPFRSDDQALRWHGFTRPPRRRRRLHLFAQAYGWSQPEVLVDAVIARQRRTLDAVAALAAEGVEPQRRWVDEGYLTELAQRVRWTETHRHLLEAESP